MQTIILEPVGSACNLRCSYCYQDPVREKKKLMSREILEKIFSDSALLNRRMKIIWHGGEPLLAGLEFFKESLRAQEKYLDGKGAVNSIQTNATLITEKWARFLSENSFKVSTSIDGPKRVHDITRCDSFDRVSRGIKKLRRFTKKNGILITVQKHNVNFHQLIWEEIIKPKELANSFDVSIVSPTETNDLTPPTNKAFEFLKNLFDLWMHEDNPDISIRSFMSILRALKGGNPHLCSLEYKKCADFIAIDNLGDAYFCNRFMKREVAYLGNILSQSLKVLLETKQRFYEDVVSLRLECRECKWLVACGGGCPYYKWAGSGSFNGENPECSLRKRLFSHIKKEYLT